MWDFYLWHSPHIILWFPHHRWARCLSHPFGRLARNRSQIWVGSDTTCHGVITLSPKDCFDGICSATTYNPRPSHCLSDEGLFIRDTRHTVEWDDQASAEERRGEDELCSLRLNDARPYLDPFSSFLGLIFIFFLLFFPWDLKNELCLYYVFSSTKIIV